MTGKAYTMNEMRQIIEYIAERRAYSEVKGRKMWVDFANSKMTNRTWQSLKETFLKRILPDIHNPYYKLTMYQIASFKEGQDVEKKMNNKLEVREADNGDILDGKTKNDILSSSITNTELADKGEDHNNSKADRDSTETIVINNCYETAEDIKRDLMTPDDELKDTTKTLRDLIEFEPMTPDVQRLIDDFVSEDEGSDGEPRMQIDLDVKAKNGNAGDEPIALSDTEQTNIEKSNSADIQTEKKQVDKPETTSDNTTNNDQVEKADSSNKKIEKQTEPCKENSKTILNNSDSITASHSTMPDSLLPNNQEELNDKEKTNKKSLSLNKNDKTLKQPISNESDGNKPPAKRKNENRTNSVSSTNSEKRKNRQTSKRTKMTNNKIEIKKVDTIVETPLNVSEEAQISKESNIQNESAQSQNPCLQSVNLYNETIGDAKNSDTDDTIQLSEQQAGTSKQQPKNDVVVLKSHSESGSSLSEPERRRLCLMDSKRYKDNTLANVFGFKSGAVRRRNSRNRKRSISHQRVYDVSSGSEDWTSDSVSEYVSPPRGRRNRQTKKFLKPKSSRVRSLEKNGGLFVVYNNRIYPLVKDGKLVKNHLSYVSDDESDVERKVWKKKYLEEKKRAEELERLLNRMQEKNRIEERMTEMAVCSSKCSNAQKTQAQCLPQDTIKKEEGNEKVENKSVKIKFTKNDEEVQLEGPLSHITPALAQVMQLLQKADLSRANPMEHDRASTPSVVAVSIDDVHEKVNKLESEIFKEIEEQDKNDSIADNITEDQSSDGNVTKRAALRRRAVSSSSVSPRGATKKPRVEKGEKPQRKQDKTPPTDKDTVRETRQTRTPRKVDNEISKSEGNTSRRSSRVKTTEIPEKTEIQNTRVTKDESDIKYKFPSPPPSGKKAQGRNTRKSQKKSNRYTKTKEETVQSNISHSSDSLQSYQDSDASPPNVVVRSKPNVNLASISCINEETESSNSFHDVKQTITFHNSTLSEAYKSDSYQLLMPTITSKTNVLRSKSVKRDMSLVPKINDTLIRNVDNEDGQSSSNISPPTSPVLSIVENLSISRSLLTSVDDLQTDEIDQLESNHITLNKLMKSDQNAPKPLMEQDCRLDSDHNDGVNYHYNIKLKNTTNKTLTPTSQSLVSKLNTISLRDFNVTDSVYVRLEKLMLDSNKKSKNKDTSDTEKEQNKVVAEKSKKPEKDKTKKRSSTPRRKENTRKTRDNIKEPIVEDEHVERNSCVSRNSCPAMLQNTETNSTEDANKTLEKKPRTSKELKKLNIIKVKITKPKDKMKDQNITDKASTSQMEMNSTKSSSQEIDNSIDLIHNHSETCLQAHECVDNSVEIVDETPSIISIKSERSDYSLFNVDEFLAQEVYNTNARDGIEENLETQLTAECPDLFFTPLGPLSSANSLMTEDLTIDIPEKTPTPSTKWFLLSEDEATTNFVDLNQNVLPKDVGYGSNLNDLFPVTCAVPDLSTITEMSKENDADTRSNLNVSLPSSKMY